MVIRQLSTKNFRNLNSLELSFSKGVNLFLGHNGSGKTNLLEAIFTLCLGRSHRGAADAVMVGVGGEGFLLKGCFETEFGEQNPMVAYQTGSKKKITIDSVPTRVAELYGKFCAVSSGPDDSEILSGPPSVRRLFLNIYLSQLSQAYFSEMSNYRRALAQKNAALRAERNFSPFVPQLIAHGSRIVQIRHQLLAQLAPLAERNYEEVSDGEQSSIRYLPSVPVGQAADDLSAVEERFEAALRENAIKEKVLKTSIIGPHRDDVRFEIDGLEARLHGSRGQWRTAAVALKLAVFELLTQKRGNSPVLLLDEIFAELDSQRASRLMELFGGGNKGQVFITAATEPQVQLPDNTSFFRISRGSVEGTS